MKVHMVLVVLTLGVAGCNSTDFGDRLQTEGADITALGDDWKKGDLMIERGNTLIKKGRKKVEQGEGMISTGESLVEEGRELKQSAENKYEAAL